MFEVGWSEYLLIFGLALVVLGPEKLPKVAASIGRWVGRARVMARQFRDQLETEAEGLRSTVQDVQKDFQSAASDVQSGLNDVQQDVQTGLQTDYTNAAAVDSAAYPATAQPVESAAVTDTLASAGEAPAADVAGADGVASAAAAPAEPAYPPFSEVPRRDAAMAPVAGDAPPARSEGQDERR